MAERLMKNSGIDWIKEIPSCWDIYKVKKAFDRKDAKAEQEDPVILSLARDGVKIRDISNNEGQLAESYYNYNPVEPGDLLLNPMDLYSGANCSLSKVSGVISPAYMNLRAKTGFDPRFYDYYFKTQYWGMALFAHGKGVSFDNRWTLGRETLMNYYIPHPSYEEQARIADFLDKKISEIDAVISKTKGSIEDYKKLKQSIITEAVTKGLDSNVEMKGSKIEWVESIPKTWREVKTLYCLSMPITDGPHETPELFDEGIPFVSAEAVSCGNGGIDFNHIRGYISKEFYKECCKKYIPQKNDVYMIKSGATTGRVSIVNTDEIFTIWSPLAVFRCNEKECLPKFLFYALQAEYYQKQVEFGWTFGTQQNIGMRTLEQLKLIVPNISEQIQIVLYLDEKISKLNNLISKKDQVITELEHYKKSIIYECVTGKKEV